MYIGKQIKKESGEITLKKAELVKAVTQEVAISGEKASMVINVVFETIAKKLAEGDSYNQDNFGTFKIVTRAARKGRNPQNGDPVDIPEKKTVKFIISGTLKKQVN